MKQASEMTTAELAQYVIDNSTTGDPDQSLGDWLNGGDLDGMTAVDVVMEWDADREYMEVQE